MSFRTTVFGLDVLCDSPLLLLRGATAPATGRTLSIVVDRKAPDAPRWPGHAERICDHHDPDGLEVFRIEADPELGYLLAGQSYGSHVLSADGRRLTSWPEQHEDAVWQRLLIAQVLPFAALLQGLEVFHASAVASDTRAVALLGRSGMGKSSLAVELCRRGAGFLADDVVALEADRGELVAHPGTQIAGVAAVRAQHEVVAVNARERLIGVPSAPGPLPLSALFFLERRPDGPATPRFEACGEPQMLLAATFNFVIAAPERLRRLLDVCALAACLRVERILLGPTTSVAELALLVEQRLSAGR